MKPFVTLDWRQATMTQHKPQKQLWVELLIWVAAEVALTLVGLDTLADYGEFMLDIRAKVATTQLDATTLA
jgi:hypothetical protein